ncbi:MAG: holo-ACP synthase [bacterium]|jgi:holo-[acyl-carrier protein] synthase
MIWGTGIDIVEIDRIERMVARKGDRFLNRVFTVGEIAYCRRSRRPGARLAARFAAKEAVLKALGLGLRRMKWADIEIIRDELGKPIVRLSGKAAAVAAERGIREIHLSLSHGRDYACAQAIAV